jgi:hypothetical protein
MLAVAMNALSTTSSKPHVRCIMLCGGGRSGAAALLQSMPALPV